MIGLKVSTKAFLEPILTLDSVQSIPEIEVYFSNLKFSMNIRYWHKKYEFIEFPYIRNQASDVR